MVIHRRLFDGPDRVYPPFEELKTLSILTKTEVFDLILYHAFILKFLA